MRNWFTQLRRQRSPTTQRLRVVLSPVCAQGKRSYVPAQAARQKPPPSSLSLSIQAVRNRLRPTRGRAICFSLSLLIQIPVSSGSTMQRHPEWSLILAHPGQSVESTHKITHHPIHHLQGHFLKSTGSHKTNATRLRRAASWSQGGVPAPSLMCSCQCPRQTRREGGLRKKRKKDLSRSSVLSRKGNPPGGFLRSQN